MWPQLYGVCYCLSNRYAIFFKHNRRFDYQPQFQDRQKPHPLFHVAQYGDDIIGRELNLRKLPGRQWESNPQPSEQLQPITIKTSASTETVTAAYMHVVNVTECLLVIRNVYTGCCYWRHMSQLFSFPLMFKQRHLCVSAVLQRPVLKRLMCWRRRSVCFRSSPWRDDGRPFTSYK